MAESTNCLWESKKLTKVFLIKSQHRQKLLAFFKGQIQQWHLTYTKAFSKSFLVILRWVSWLEDSDKQSCLMLNCGVYRSLHTHFADLFGVAWQMGERVLNKGRGRGSI